MRNIILGICLLGGLVFSHTHLLSVCSTAQKLLPVSGQGSYVVPSPLVEIAALEYRGIAADILFLKSLVFFGSTMERGANTVEMEEWEWSWVIDLLDVVTDLDPYFFDPYYFGGSILSLNPDMVDRVNVFLEKGSQHRQDDWYLPFFIGWNYFFQKQDNLKASRYLMESYRRNPNNTLIATLASRLSYQGSRTEDSIIFLRGIVATAKEDAVKALYLDRLLALEGILAIETARDDFYKEKGSFPDTVEQLLALGYLDELPVDPYGGSFYITEKHEIKTTSNLSPHMEASP